MLADQANTNTINREEEQYLNLIRRVLENGDDRSDRTGTGTLSVFGPQLLFDLCAFPLLTTKKVYLRPIFEELMWIGEALDKLGFASRREGDLGPVYGFQWRHFGAKYVDCHTDYTGQGVDQLHQVIDKILHSPTDRRIILSAWNPSALTEMALPPCHMFCQFYVSNGKLSCQLYQRSCDIGLGVPFNIASYALLTCLIAQVTGLQVGEFIHCMGDAHIYKDHIEPLKSQLERTPYQFPRLLINLPFGPSENLDPKERVNDCLKRLEAVQFTDIELTNYVCHQKLDMKMSV